MNHVIDERKGGGGGGDDNRLWRSSQIHSTSQSLVEGKWSGKQSRLYTILISVTRRHLSCLEVPQAVKRVLARFRFHPV